MTEDPACNTKDPLTRAQACKVAKRIRTRRGSPVQAYKCRTCRAWHVGNRPFFQRRQKP